jgi:hypothetical protein
MRRFQLYNWLMEACFWVSAGILAWIVLGKSLPAVGAYMRPFGSAVRILMNIDILLAVFLVAARFMRDEFAERIWQRSAHRFVNLVVIGPFAVIIGIVVFLRQIKAALPDLLPDQLIAILAKEPDPAYVFFIGIGATFVLVAQFVPLFFIIIYKWSLWRDSR